MTTLQQTTLTCPCCCFTFGTQTVLQTNSFGGKRTDFHERAAGKQPTSYFVQVCPNCFYAGVEEDFGGERSQGYGQQVRDSKWVRVRAVEILRGIPSTDIPGCLKWELAALCAFASGGDMRIVGDRYLRAAWCCVDDGDLEAERYFRLAAAKSFTSALRDFDTIEREQRPVITYLVGELWRRIGDNAQARQWFDKVESEVTDRNTQEWVVDAARTQASNHPREYFR